MSLIGTLHQHGVYGRRIRVLAEHLAPLFDPSVSVADVGCGDGALGAAIGKLRPDLSWTGYDVLVRPETAFPVKAFDGKRLPLEDESVDVVMMVDVVHHAEDPAALLREAHRVARHGLVLKDHLCENAWDHLTLRFMDHVGNARHGVALPYHYWSHSTWREAFTSLGLETGSWQIRLPLYPFPVHFLFGRSLHFMARLNKTGLCAPVT